MKIRENGFINLDTILWDKVEFDSDGIKLLVEDSSVKIVKNQLPNQMLITFLNDGCRYYFKYDSLSSGYMEVLASLLAHDFGIEAVNYDLAKLGPYYGAISANYKRNGYRYITGEYVLLSGIPKVQIDKDDMDGGEYYDNTLTDIWIKLEERYRKRSDKNQIVEKLMSEIVNMYVFDVLTGQADRNSLNWEIVETPLGDVYLQPLFDNIRMMVCTHPSYIRNVLKASKDSHGLGDDIRKFFSHSTREFANLIQDKLWIISEENIRKNLAIIEKRIGTMIPDGDKNMIIRSFIMQYEYIECILATCYDKNNVK